MTDSELCSTEPKDECFFTRSLERLQSKKRFNKITKSLRGHKHSNSVDIVFPGDRIQGFQNANERQPVAPLVVEDPPSIEHTSDVEDTISHLDGSSSNFGSSVVAHSTPGTPQATITTTNNTSSSSTGLNESINSSIYSSIPRSPTHSLFSKMDKGAVKQLSSSTPVMVTQTRSPTDTPSPKIIQEKEEKLPVTSKSRQKKFHRHFPSVDLDEKVLNYYSCALIADILLQGRLYITKNYFAFHSNVFGYVTKLLIPLLSVEKITKEKTARIIPNAVGISTSEEKHVFGSLMSRDNTYRFMNKVWDAARNNAQLVEQFAATPPSECSDSTKSSESGSELMVPPPSTVEAESCVRIPTLVLSEHSEETQSSFSLSKTFNDKYTKLLALPMQTVLLYASTFLLLLLFLSAAILLYRIGKIQEKYISAIQDHAFLMKDNKYENLLQWQSQLHGKSAEAVHNFLDSNLNQLAKVRQSLEILSSLLTLKSEEKNEPKSSGLS